MFTLFPGADFVVLQFFGRRYSICDFLDHSFLYNRRGFAFQKNAIYCATQNKIGNTRSGV